MSALGVYSDDLSAPQDDQSWLVNRITDGVKTVQLDVNTFLGANEAAYFASIGDDDTTGYVKSGIPLARITSGDTTGSYGPYDPNATDGRNGPIEGLLESQFPVTFTRSGVKVTAESVGMRYMGVIDTSKLPYAVDGAKWDGIFLDCPLASGPVTVLSTTPGSGAAAPAYTLPAATANTLGGVKQSADVADVAADADAAALAKKVNELLAALRTAGVVAKS